MKGILKTAGIFFAAIGMAGTGYAQETLRTQDSVVAIRRPAVKPKAPKAIKSELSGGLRLNSNGWSLYTDYGMVKAKNAKQADMFHNVRIVQLEFTEKKSPTEYKVSGGETATGNSYIYGKINNFYAVKLGYGVRTLLAGKPDPGTVSIHWVNAGGLALGLLKPYYINVYSDPSAISYKDPNKGNFLNQNYIDGNAGFSTGISETQIVPGAHFKSAVHFDFSTNRTSVLGVEAGFNVEYYSKPIAIMANQSAVPVFFDLFVAVQFGKRW